MNTIVLTFSLSTSLWAEIGGARKEPTTFSKVLTNTFNMCVKAYLTAPPNPRYLYYHIHTILNLLSTLGLLMKFIRATRESDWNLHLSSLRSMLPFFFAANRVNYSRYATAYWLEMITLDKTHPG